MEHANKIPSLLKGSGLPNYKEITPNEITKHLPSLIKKLNNELNSLEEIIEQNNSPRWEDIMTPLYKISERLRWSWGAICHLNGVCNSDQLRKAYSSQQPDIIRFSNRIGQSKIIHRALCKLKQSQFKFLDNTQIRILDKEILSMKNRGVGLEGKERDDFNIISERLGELSNKFSNNVLDATKQWTFLLTNHSQVDGLPVRTLESLAQSAKESNQHIFNKDNQPNAKDGPWLMTIDMPTYISFMTYGKDRKLREKIYKAHIGKASEGAFNNKELIEEILNLRQKQSELLGYKNWAELSLSNKMANDVYEVEKLLEELREAAMPRAKKELEELKDCADRNNAPESEKLAPWDIAYWSECLQQEKFDLNQETLRPWFPLPQVLNGLFSLCEKLFDIKIKSGSGNIPKWHDDVKFFDVLDNQEKIIASFYLDPYTRPKSKRGGAWMDECLIREKSNNERIVLPVAYLICNQTPPIGDTPSLMSFEEVKTLFHEFGHGLQHMLTTINYPQASGINNVDWDAVELPSQFMENWCLEKKTLGVMAKHWETGEPLPETELKKLKNSKTFNSGLSTLRQVHFALTDIKLHSNWNKQLGISPDELRREIAKTTTAIPPIPEDQFLCAFSHIFAGGYAAGYYSYKWAEVLSADAFSAFEEVGLENETEIKKAGKRFKDTVLSLGGSQDPSKVFQMFRERGPTTKALIRHSGLDID